MLQCANCERWYHGDCVGLNEKAAEGFPIWHCADCGSGELDVDERFPGWAGWYECENDCGFTVQSQEEVEAHESVIGYVFYHWICVLALLSSLASPL